MKARLCRVNGKIINRYVSCPDLSISRVKFVSSRGPRDILKENVPLTMAQSTFRFVSLYHPHYFLFIPERCKTVENEKKKETGKEVKKKL